MVGTDRALRSAAEAGLPAVVIASGRTPAFPDAAAVRRGYDGYTDGSGPLLAAGCQQLRRRWLTDRGSAQRRDHDAEVLVGMFAGQLGVEVGGVTAQRGARAGGGHRIHRQPEILAHQGGGETGREVVVGR